MKPFEALIAEAEAWEMQGWDFSSLGKRWTEGRPPWDYRAKVRTLMREANCMLDMGTGGGEFLYDIRPLPPHTYATEGYPPNVPISKSRLSSLGVEVIQTFSEDNAKTPQYGGLPFKTGYFDLVINRHESFIASEVHRVLKPSGRFLSQQVGSENLAELNELLGAEPPSTGTWDLEVAIRQLKASGFRIEEGREASIESEFRDIGAVVCCLKAIPWQIPGFTVSEYLNELRRLDERMRARGGLKVSATRFLIRGSKEGQESNT